RLQRELQQFIDVEPFYGGLFHLNLSQGSSLAGTRMNWPFILSPCAAAGHSLPAPAPAFGHGVSLVYHRIWQ
ncbi:MAG: hypothetical protein DMG32_02670, partial [Acidobacteria bacterium]